MKIIPYILVMLVITWAAVSIVAHIKSGKKRGCGSCPHKDICGACPKKDKK